MIDPPSWIPPQAPTYTSNCTALSEAELVELVAQAMLEAARVHGVMWGQLARAAIAALRLAGAMK